MKRISLFCCALSSTVFLSSDAGAFSCLNTSLIDTIQAFESLPQAALVLGQPALENSYKLASVSFITGGGKLTFAVPEFPDVSPQKCRSLGFTKTSCLSGVPTGICPYNSSYFSQCCDKAYKYSKAECAYPNTISGSSCGGKFMCYCDRSLYKVTASSCKAPLVPASGTGESCFEDGVVYYSGCVCPATHTQVCKGANMEGVGDGCTANGETKYTSCQCKSGYNLTCSDSAPVTPTDYCLKDGIKYYNNCKTCPNACTLDSCPAGMTCTLEECSGKYCASACSTGYVDLENYWCGGALKCLVK